MAFITIFKRVAPQNRRIGLNPTYKMYSYGRCVNLQHFYVDWEDFRSTESFRTKTPLFKFSIGKFQAPFAGVPSAAERALRTHPKTLYVSYNTNHSKRAHSHSFTYTLRERIWRVVNSMPLEGGKNNLVSIFISNFAVFASPDDIEHHLRLCIQKYLDKKENTKEVMPKVRQRDFFSVLFPFSLEKWGNFPFGKRYFQNLHGPLGIEWFNIYLSHHYRINSSVQRQELRADLHDFQQMLQKFNFIDVITKIEFANDKHSLSRCRRLVRILKWRTLESEEYLVFLINEFGGGKVMQALQLFEKVYKTFPSP